jgi:hypothetical protein
MFPRPHARYDAIFNREEWAWRAEKMQEASLYDAAKNK